MPEITEAEMAALLAAGTGSLETVWAEVLTYLRRTNQIEDVEAMIIAGRYDDAIQNIQQAAERVAEETVRQFVVAATAAARAASGMSNRMISYNGSNPTAVRMLDLQRLDIMVGLQREQREVIQQIIREGITRGTNPLRMARDIVYSLGLTPEQQRIVSNFRNELRRGDYKAAMRRQLADGRWAPKLRPGVLLSDADVERMTDNYRAAWQVHRAQTLARTEALTALHEGMEETFRQAFETGELNPDEIEVIWSSALRAHTRDSHRAMHNQTRKVGETFISGNGYQLRYPGDPRAPASERCNCLCVLRRRMRPRMDVAFV